MRCTVPARVSLVGLIVLGSLAATKPRPAHVTLFFTAETRGELVPCGCSRRGGGLARRAALVRRLRSDCPELVLVETGNLARTPEQLSVVARALRRMGYDAVGFGTADAALNQEYARTLNREKLPALDSGAGTEMPPIRRLLLRNAAGVRIGILATGPWTADAGEQSARRARLAVAVHEARRRSDLLVLLTDWPRPAAEQLSEALGLRASDLILTAAPDLQAPAQRTGEARILSAKPLGETATRVDVSLIPGRAPQIRSTALPVDEQWGSDAVIDRWCGDYVQLMTRRVKVVAGLPPAAGTTGLATFDYAETTPAGTVLHRVPNFLNAAQCGACHSRALQVWQTSAHARTYATLRQRDRLIPDCLPCHSETYRRLEALENPAAGGSGVECSTCHGSGLTHAQEKGARGAIYRGAADAQTEALCRRCHTPAQSPQFNFREFLARISH